MIYKYIDIWDLALVRVNLETNEAQFRFKRKIKSLAEVFKLSKYLRGLKKNVFFDVNIYAYTQNPVSERFCKHLGFERLTQEKDKVKWLKQH